MFKQSVGYLVFVQRIDLVFSFVYIVTWKNIVLPELRYLKNICFFSALFHRKTQSPGDVA